MCPVPVVRAFQARVIGHKENRESGASWSAALPVQTGVPPAWSSSNAVTLPDSHLDEFIGRTQPASLERGATQPLSVNLPKCGQKAITAQVRSTSLTERPASVHQCIDFSALTFIAPWHLPCSLDRVVGKLEILTFNPSLARKTRGG